MLQRKVDFNLTYPPLNSNQLKQIATNIGELIVQKMFLFVSFITEERDQALIYSA